MLIDTDKLREALSARELERCAKAQMLSDDHATIRAYTAIEAWVSKHIQIIEAVEALATEVA